MSGLSSVEKSILKTLLYYDVFEHPMLSNEIFVQLDMPYHDPQMKVLNQLIDKGLVKQFENYFYLYNRDEEIVNSRIKVRNEAESWLKMARKHVWWLSLFPFVECVCISGSLSKYSINKNGDIDYFVIISENRLWIFKFFVSVLVKTFSPFGIKKYFCPNYMIASNQLCIPQHTFYSAIEISTLIPIYNSLAFKKFIKENEWYKSFLPNSEHFDYRYLNKMHNNWGYILLKKVFDWKFFTLIDKKLFGLYKWKWGNKFEKFDEVSVNKNSIKMHNSGHAKRITTAYRAKIAEFETQYNVTLNQS